jgi:hypothetical protein
MKKLERARINLRIPDPLLVWAKAYAFRTNRTLTQLIVDLLSGERVRILKDGYTDRQ